MTPETLLDDELLTVTQAAALLNCNPETVRRAIRRGDLPATRPLGARGWLVHPNDLKRLEVAA